MSIAEGKRGKGFSFCHWFPVCLCERVKFDLILFEHSLLTECDLVLTTNKHLSNTRNQSLFLCHKHTNIHTNTHAYTHTLKRTHSYSNMQSIKSRGNVFESDNYKKQGPTCAETNLGKLKKFCSAFNRFAFHSNDLHKMLQVNKMKFWL